MKRRNQKLEMRNQKLEMRNEKLQMRMNNFKKITQLKMLTFKKNQKRLKVLIGWIKISLKKF